MYQSIPSFTIIPTHGRPPGFANSSCPWSRVFAPLFCPGVCPRGILTQSKSLIILKKRAIFALSLKQMSSSSFHMFIYARSKRCDLGPIYTTTNTQRIRIYPGTRLKSIQSWSKFYLIQDVTMVNMPKKTTRYSRCLLLRIYPDSPVHMSAKQSVFKFVQLCCKFTRVNAFTP